MKSFPPFQLDEVNQCVWRGNTRVALMPKPFAVLRHLVDHAGTLVTHEQLLAAIWPDTYVQPEVLRRYILEIRRALGDDPDAPRFIETLTKRGYQFIAKVTDEDLALDDEAAVRTSNLVGRASTLADLRRSLAAAQQGRRQLVFIVGEAGIGKTSLVDAFQHSCASLAGVVVARGQSVEGFGGKEPYYPLLEAIGQLGRGPSRSIVVDTLGRTAPTWFVQFPSLIKPEQQAALQREITGATRERMVRELCEALEIITRSVTLVLVLEDLHWVDNATLDVLSVLARRREAARLLVIGTLRPAELILTDSPLKALKQDLLVHRLTQELQLERLQESDVADYVAAAFAPSNLPRGLATVIYRHSDGNPLFMVAMLDHLARKGVLSYSNGRWTMTTAPDRVDPEVPETLRQMLEMQLQHLNDGEQLLLKAASVAGHHFTIWSLAAMLEDDEGGIEAQCETLVDRQQFLKFSGMRELGEDTSSPEYRFAHALYREVLYRRLNPNQRLVFHRRLATRLTELQSAANRELAGEIALHFEEAHDYDRAIRHLMTAAENATRRHAHQQSVSVLEHARGLLAKGPETERGGLALQVAERIGNAYYAIGDLQRSALEYESMAVRAADAGMLSAHADTLLRIPHSAELAPFFLKAIELDADFVAAYVTLSRIYSNLGEADRAKDFAKRAYERRDRVSQRDRLSVTYQFHSEVTGDLARARDTLEAWKSAFPEEFQPVNSLALLHNFLGDFARAIEEGQEAVRRNALHGYPYSNLAHAYRGMGRFADAKRTAEEAVALQIETLPTRRLLYQLAESSGDDEAAVRHRRWARDKPREFDMIGAHAQITASSGRVREARALYEEAVRMAERRNFPDVGSSHLAWGLSMEWAYGNHAAAEALARRVLARDPSYDPRLRAALALAIAGAGDEAEAIAAELAEANPSHTLINAVLVPMVRAGLALRRDDPATAIAALVPAVPYELGFIAALTPIYLRGQSLLRARAGHDAAVEFQRILDHRGSDPFSPFHAVALVGLARARALAGDVASSRSEYRQFLDGWKDADSDVPILIEAREELDRLERSH